METLSLIVAILLSLAGYSGGVTGRSGRGSDPKPGAVDLLLNTSLWAGAVCLRLMSGLNRWLVILVCLAVSAAAGAVSASLRRFPKSVRVPQTQERPAGPVTRVWRRWKAFSKRMGGFQSRIVMSFFYFLLVTPLGLAVRSLSDPLGIKKRPEGSFWSPRAQEPDDPERFRRQF